MYKLIIILVILLALSSACQKKAVDTTPPELTLLGTSPFYVNKDSAYVEPGYRAVDDVDGDISARVEVSGTVDVHTEGSYILRYNVSDEAGNAAPEAQREVRVTVF